LNSSRDQIILSKKAGDQHEELTENIYISQAGYAPRRTSMEAFLVNETSENVWFGQFRIQNTTPVILQETHGACPESEAIRKYLGCRAAGTWISAGGDQGQ